MRKIRTLNKNKLKVTFSVVFLFLFTMLIYSNSLNNSFMWDDHNLILQNRFIKDFKYIPYFFSTDRSKRAYNVREREYRPLTKINFALNYKLWKNNPKGYHLTNIVLHSANTILLFFLLRFLLLNVRIKTGKKEKDNPNLILTIAFFGALFFVSQPVTTEAVDWIKNSSILLSVFFCLLSFFVFSKSLLNTEKIKSYIYYFLSLFLFILSLLSKESGISLPLILAISIAVIYNRFDIKKIIIKTGPFFFIAALFLLTKYLLFNQSSPELYTQTSISPYTRILIVFQSFGEYLSILLWPFFLNAERIFLKPTSFLEIKVLLGLFSLSLFIFAIVRTFKISKLLSFLIFWLGLTLLAISNIIFVETRPIAEQRLYFPCISFSMILSLSIGMLSLKFMSRKIPRKNILFYIALMGLIISLGYTASTVKRNAIWKTPDSFWAEATRVSSLSSRANDNLGSTYYAHGDYTTAAKYHEIAIKIKPDNSNAYLNLGVTFAALKKTNEALSLLHHALKLDPYNAEIYNNLGIAYSSIDNKEKAIASYENAILLNPNLSWAYHNLGAIYAMNKIKDKALIYLNKALEIDPHYAGTYNNIGNLYKEEGEKVKAVEAYIKALTCQPGYYKSMLNLSRLFAEKGYFKESAFSFAIGRNLLSSTKISNENPWHNSFSYVIDSDSQSKVLQKDSDTFIIIADAYKMIGEETKAEKYYKKALKSSTDRITALNRLGILYASMKEPEKAIPFFSRAIDLDPGQSEAYNNTGIALHMTGDIPAAENMFRKAMVLDPTNPTSPNNLFRLLEASGKKEEALLILQSAIEANNNSPILYETLITNLMDSGDLLKVREIYNNMPENIELDSITYNNIGIAFGSIGQIDKALDLFKMSVSSDSNNSEALYNLALTYMDKGLFESADKNFEQALNISPENLEIISSFALSCLERHKTERAEQLYKKILVLSPNNLNAINSLGILYSSTGRHDEAEKLFLDIIDKDPNNIGAIYNLGNIYFLRQDREQAINFFKKVIALNPSYAPAYIKLTILYVDLQNPEQAKYYYEKAKRSGLTNLTLEQKLYPEKESNE